jgi:hypothetical protein
MMGGMNMKNSSMGGGRWEMPRHCGGTGEARSKRKDSNLQRPEADGKIGSLTNDHRWVIRSCVGRILFAPWRLCALLFKSWRNLRRISRMGNPSLLIRAGLEIRGFTSLVEANFQSSFHRYDLPSLWCNPTPANCNRRRRIAPNCTKLHWIAKSSQTHEKRRKHPPATKNRILATENARNA